MQPIDWIEDKQKEGEIFTNSYCFSYCLKCFWEENRVELWASRKGYAKTYLSWTDALDDYAYIKTLGYLDILAYVMDCFEEITA